MTLAQLLRLLGAPVRDFGRELSRDLGMELLGVGLAMAGGGFVIAAGYIGLSRVAGNLWAAVLLGGGLLLAGALVLVIRRSQRLEQARDQARARAEQAATATTDPLPGLVFDLAYLAGRQIFAKRRG